MINVVAAILSKLPARPSSGPVYAAIRDFGEANSWWLIILATSIIAFTSLLKKSIGPPDTWDTLHELMDSLHAVVFNGENYAVPDEHKVTIFKAVPTCVHDSKLRRIFGRASKRARWLVPVVRSGHTSQDTRTCFKLDDAGEKCEGVAGQVWARGKVVAVSDLPDVSGTTSPPSKNEINRYADATYVTNKRIKEKIPKSRALLGLPIMVRGQPWGVLVFDSRNPQRIQYDEMEHMFRVVLKHLNQLISKHL